MESASLFLLLHISISNPGLPTNLAYTLRRSSLSGRQSWDFQLSRANAIVHFGEYSDIDVALCSDELFDAIWKDVFDYWARPEFWLGLDDFRKYLFRGWIKFPIASKSFARSQEWWEFFRQLTTGGDFGPYKVTGALYKNWHFLEKYQEKCVHDCKLSENIAP